MVIVILVRTVGFEAVCEGCMAACRGDQTEYALVHVHKHAAAVSAGLQHFLLDVGLISEALGELEGRCVLAIAALLLQFPRDPACGALVMACG